MPPTQPRYASAGNAREESTNTTNDVGLYRQEDPRLPGYGKIVGVIDPIQGDAVIRQGYMPIPGAEGMEAAKMSEEEIEAKFGKPKSAGKESK